MTKNQCTSAHVINIDELSTFLGKEIYENGSKLHQIHKIKSNSREKYKKDYEPSHLSIGPYHHGTPALHAIEKVKWSCLNYFLELNHEMNIHDYIEALNRLEKKARRFYGDDIEMNRKSFVQMLLLDACFILVTLNGPDEIASDFKTSVEGEEIKMDDHNNDQLVIDVDENKETNEWYANGDGDNSYEIHERSRAKIYLRDMLLLENQIPFFILAKIYEIVTKGRSSISKLVKNIIQFMLYTLGYSCHPEAIQKYNPPQQIYHLLHLCHMVFKPHRTEEEKCQNHVMRSLPFHNYLHLGSKYAEEKLSRDHGYEILEVRSVTQFHKARIEFKERKFSSDILHSLLDIRFVNGTLEIPYLNVDLETFSLLKNLIAFEQLCPHQSGNYVTSYITFWVQFIPTSDDVALLIEKGIIKHGFHRDSEVVDQFRSLSDCIAFDLNGDNYLASLCQTMEAHYQIGRPKWSELFAAIKSKVHAWTRDSTFELPT